MNYPRILQCVYGEPWLILPSTLDTIQQVLAERIEGNERSTVVFQRQNHFSAQALGLTPPRSIKSRVYRSGKMAFIPVQGVIGKNLSLMEAMCGGYNIDQLAQDVGEVMADASIQNVVVGYDSPGGRVQGVPETAKLLAEMRGVKNTFSFTDAMAASAAYWLFSQAEHRYITESAAVGAVGVIVALVDRTKQLEMQGVTVTVIKAGAHKGAGMPGNPMTAEQIQMIQDQVNLFYEMMVGDINRAHKGISPDSLQGQLFVGSQVIKAKLADATVTSLGALVQKLS